MHVSATFRNTYRVVGADVLGAEADGNPAFTRFELGNGEVFLLSCPIETALLRSPEAYHRPDTDAWWQVYRLVAEKALARRAARKTHPLLGLTEHSLDETQRVLIAINYSDSVLSDRVSLDDSWSVASIWRGNDYVSPDDDHLDIEIPPVEAAVFVLQS